MPTPYLSPAGRRVLAHRGLALEHEENTAGAFAAALAAGASHLETDVRVSADGVAVLWHDEDLSRLAGSNARVSQLEWAELSRLDLAGGRVLRLDEALAAFPEARFNIDLKVEAAIAPTVAAVRAAGAVDRVLLTSFSDGRRRRAVAALPGVASSIGTGALLRVLLATALFGQSRLGRRIWRGALAGACAAQVPRRYWGVPIVTRRFIAAAHAAGIEVHVWTINEPAEMRELWALGVDGLVTDRCDLAVATLPA